MADTFEELMQQWRQNSLLSLLAHPSVANPAAGMRNAGPMPTIDVYAQPGQVQAPLNQANPNFTAGIQGAVGTQSGQPVHATYDQPPAPDTVTAARTYRAQHGLATSDDTDALNAESLAAAQAGRTYLNPTLAAQYGQPLAAGVSGPRTDVINALTMPAGTAQTAVAQQQPVVLAQNNLLAQGIY